MLGSMRSKKNMSVVYVILGLLILGLIGFGGSQLGSRGPDSFGKIGDVDLEIDDYVRSYQNTSRQIEQALGRRLSAEEAERFGLFSSTLSQVTSNAALDNLNAEIGLSVGDQTVAQEIQRDINFQALGGGFDRDAYNAALERAGQTPAQFETRIRRENARALTQLMLLAGAASNETTAATLLTYAGETRDFEFARIDDSALDALPTAPDEATLRAYYDSNPEAYTALETKIVRYVVLSPESIIDTIDIDAALLREAYDEQSNRFNQPARRAVDRLVYPDQAAAEAARNRLDGGDVSFDDLVAERGLSLADIDMGEILETALPEAAREVVFGAPDLGTVGPVDTDLGPALFRINAIFDANVTSFEAAREELRRELARDEAVREINAIAPDVEDLLAAGATFEEIVAETPMEFGTIDIDANSNTGIAAYGEFRAAVNMMNPGDFAELLDLSDGGIFSIEVEEIRPPQLKPFADVKDQVTADWTAAETLAAVTDKAASLLDEVKLGTAFGTLGLSPEQRFDTTRDAFIENAPEALVSTAFDLDAVAPNNVALVEGEDAAFLVRVTKITPTDLASEDSLATIEGLSGEIGNQISREMYDALTSALSKDAAINLQVLNQINMQLTGGVVGHGN